MSDTAEPGTVHGAIQADSSIASSWREFTRNLWLLFPILWETIKAFCMFLFILLKSFFGLLARVVTLGVSKVSNMRGKDVVNVETNQDKKV